MDVARDQHSAVALAWAHWAVSLFPTPFYARSPAGVEMGGGQLRGTSWLVPVFCLSLLPAESVSKHSKGGSLLSYPAFPLGVSAHLHLHSPGPDACVLTVTLSELLYLRCWYQASLGLFCGRVCEHRRVLLSCGISRHVCKPG